LPAEEDELDAGSDSTVDARSADETADDGWGPIVSRSQRPLARLGDVLSIPARSD
jgi:hypothetical protein